MKKKISVSVGIMVFVLVIAGIVTNYADSAKVTTGHEPKYCIKMVKEDGSKITYWGLGYKIIRYVGVSPKEPYENNIGVKMGSWFMKYDKPIPNTIQIEYDGKIIEINQYQDRNKIYHILTNSKYDAQVCNGINTHKITMDNEVYWLKESCQEIQKEDKQAYLTNEDLETILKIIENSQSDKE